MYTFPLLSRAAWFLPPFTLQPGEDNLTRQPNTAPLARSRSSRKATNACWMTLFSYHACFQTKQGIIPLLLQVDGSHARCHLWKNPFFRRTPAFPQWPPQWEGQSIAWAPPSSAQEPTHQPPPHWFTRICVPVIPTMTTIVTTPLLWELTRSQWLCRVLCMN